MNRDQSRCARSMALAVVIAAGAFAVAATPRIARADMMSGAQAKALCAQHDVGPLTPYGETAEESVNKRVVFEWNCGTMVERNVRGAFEKYVSRDWCDYGHLINQMKKQCGNFDETIAFFSRMAGGGKPLGDTDMLEFPTQSSVNGPMVTMYGAGVDIFEVRNGKIVAHYDASPRKAIAFHDKKPENLPPWVPGSTRKGGPGEAGGPGAAPAAGVKPGK